jgi:hypothetical protein
MAAHAQQCAHLGGTWLGATQSVNRRKIAAASDQPFLYI